MNRYIVLVCKGLNRSTESRTLRAFKLVCSEYISLKTNILDSGFGYVRRKKYVEGDAQENVTTEPMRFLHLRLILPQRTTADSRSRRNSGRSQDETSPGVGHIRQAKSAPVHMRGIPTDANIHTVNGNPRPRDRRTRIQKTALPTCCRCPRDHSPSVQRPTLSRLEHSFPSSTYIPTHR